MNVNLVIDTARPPCTWPQFRARVPRFGIALDGFVSTGPRFDPDGPRANFNHHEEVDRLATHATCGQVLMAIRQGLFDTFRDADGPRVTAYVNDCDEDVCLSWFLLSHGHLAHNVLNPLLNRLVAMEDVLDATAGAYAFPADLPSLCELAWVFAPYRRFRASGGLDRHRTPDDYRCVIDDVGNRIARHITGSGESNPLDLRYHAIRRSADWALVDEIGAQARTGMFHDGIKAFVAVRERGDGRWTYTLGRMSPFVPFDLSELYALLNSEEKISRTNDNRWGGGHTIGGSPRIGGSGLSPDEVTRIISDSRSGEKR